MGDEYLDENEAALLLKTTASKIRRWAAIGELNARELPDGKLLFLRAEIEHWIRSRRADRVDDDASRLPMIRT